MLFGFSVQSRGKNLRQGDKLTHAEYKRKRGAIAFSEKDNQFGIININIYIYKNKLKLAITEKLL